MRKRGLMVAAGVVMLALLAVGIYGWRVAKAPPRDPGFAFLHGAKPHIANPNRHGWGHDRALYYLYKGSASDVVREAKKELLGQGWKLRSEWDYDDSVYASFRPPSSGWFLNIVNGDEARYLAIKHPDVWNHPPEQLKGYVGVSYWIQEAENVYWWRDFWDNISEVVVVGPVFVVLIAVLYFAVSNFYRWQVRA